MKAREKTKKELLDEIAVLKRQIQEMMSLSEKAELASFEHCAKDTNPYHDFEISQTNFVIRTDLTGRYTYWNPMFRDTFGWMHDGMDFRLFNAMDSIEDYHHDRAHQIVEKCLAHPGEVYQVELDKPTRDGKIRTTLWEFVCLTDKNHTPTEIQCTGIDITDRIVAEKKLKESNERTLLIMNSIDSFIYIADMHTHELLFVNDYARKAWGNDILGKKCYHTLQGYSAPCTFCTNDQLLNEDGTSKGTYQWEFQNSVNGRWYEIRDRAIRWENGKIVRLEIATDITERKSAEQKLRISEKKHRTIFENIQDVYYEASSDGTILEISPSVVQFSKGQLKREDLIGKQISQFYLNPDDRIAVTREIESRGSVNDIEVTLRNFDNEPVFAAVTARLLVDEKNNPSGIVGIIRDISERKKAENKIIERENELRESERALNDAQEIAGMGSWELSVDTNQLKWSRNFFRMLEMEYSPQPVDNSVFFHHVHPDDLPIIDNNLKLIAETQQPVTIKFRMLSQKGRVVFLENKAFPVFKDERLVTIKGTVIDISEKVAYEDEIKQQNQKLKAIISAMPDSMLIIDGTGKKIELLKTQSENLKQVRWSHFNELFQDDKQMMELHLSKLNESLEGQKMVTFDVSFNITGNEEHFETRLSPITKDQVLLLARNTSEKYQKEKAIRTLTLAIEQSPVLIAITDLEANIQYVNTAFSDVTGFGKQELIGNNARIFRSGKTDPDVYRDLWATITLGKPWKGELINKKKDGEYYWERLQITPILDEKGLISNYLAIKQDVTKEKEAENAIHQLNQELEQKVIERTSQLDEANSQLIREITERNIVNASLLLSEKLLEMAMQTAQMAWWELDIETEMLIFPYQQAEIFGNPGLNSIPVKAFHKLIHEHDEEKAANSLLSHYKGETTVYETEYRIRTANGEYIWIHDIGAISEENQGRSDLKVVGFMTNVTKRKSAELALLQKTLELENFFTLSLDLLCIFNDEGRFIKVNSAMERLLGFPAIEITEKKIFDFIHSDQFASMTVLNGLFGKHNAVRGLITPFQSKESTTHFLEWQIARDGNLYYAAAHDITDQKRSREFELELLNLTQKLTGIPYSEIDKALNLTLERIGYFLNADRVYIFELDANKKYWSNSFEWCRNGIDSQIDNLQNIAVDTFPGWMEDLQTNGKIVIPILEDLPFEWKKEKEILSVQGVKSLIALPLKSENEFIGFFGLDYVLGSTEFSETEINSLNILGNVLASLINHRYREEIIEQTRRNYETFFNTIDDFLFVLDEHGNILYTNDSTPRRLEIPAEVLQGSNVLMVHPEERRAEATEIINNMLRGTADFCPIPLVTSSGKQIPVETRVKMGLWNGQPAVFGISKDVSALVISEEKFSKAFRFNSSLMAIVMINNMQVIDINETMLNVLGYRRQEVIGESILNLRLVDDTKMIFEIEEALEQEGSVKDIELTIYKKDQSAIACLLSADKVYIGKELCVLIILTDITVRKKHEEEILRTRMEAEAANQAKSDFLSRMSHELRTPLNAILGFAQLFQMGELTSLQSKGVDHIIKSGNHLLDLINEILDIAKIEAGRISLRFEPIQIKSIVQEMIDIVHVAASDKQITIKLANSPLNRKFVNTDSQRMKQILLNLINNAVKYNIQGGRVTISTSLATQSGAGFIRISVSDTGLGISQENLARLFTPFERLGAEKTSIEGSGLGLTVVKKLVETLNGIIGVESVPDQGSTFWFELPLSDYQIEAPGIQQPDDITGELTRKRIGKILYVEDNQSNVELVKQIILNQRPNISLINIDKGENALEAAREHQPDVIFLDLNLPDIHGREVIDLLQNDSRVSDIPIIILTADAMKHQQTDLLYTGAKEYMTKPLNLMAFLKIIDTYITPKK